MVENVSGTKKKHLVVNLHTDLVNWQQITGMVGCKKNICGERMHLLEVKIGKGSPIYQKKKKKRKKMSTNCKTISE